MHLITLFFKWQLAFWRREKQGIAEMPITVSTNFRSFVSVRTWHWRLIQDCLIRKSSFWTYSAAKTVFSSSFRRKKTYLLFLFLNWNLKHLCALDFASFFNNIYNGWLYNGCIIYNMGGLSWIMSWNFNKNPQFSCISLLYIIVCLFQNMYCSFINETAWLKLHSSSV
jgi:hypothetical protein